MIVGTAVSGERLCTLRRKQGGNRVEIVGEVHVSKRSVTVTAKGRNPLGRTITEWNNKDAIVAQILKRAIQRESAMLGSEESSSVVVISQSKVLED